MTEAKLISEILIPRLKALTPGPWDENTPLIGPSAVVDSVNLVSYLLEVEELVNAGGGKRIRVVSDRALSEKSSPFQSVATLASYVSKLLSTP